MWSFASCMFPCTHLLSQAQGHTRIPWRRQCPEDGRRTSGRSRDSGQLRRGDEEEVRGSAGEEVDQCGAPAEKGTDAAMETMRSRADRRRYSSLSNGIRASSPNSTRQPQPHSYERTRIPQAGCLEHPRDIPCSHIGNPSHASHSIQSSRL